MHKNNYMSFRSKEVDHLRRYLKMQPLQSMTRQCLKCNRKFDSEGAHNRMCPVCSKSADKVNNTGDTYAE